MLDSLAVTLQVTQVLESLQVPYFIGGSLAGIIYGEYRTTQDTDIVAALRPGHVQPLVQALEATFYIQAAEIETALQDAQQYGMDPAFRACFNLIHSPTGFKIDVFIPAPRPFEEAEFQRRVREVLTTDPEQTAYVATAEDIILAKLEWYKLGGAISTNQWRDVVAMLKVQGDQLDGAYLDDWAVRLGLDAVFAQARAAAEQP
jgi:hypothetical protein